MKKIDGTEPEHYDDYGRMLEDYDPSEFHADHQAYGAMMDEIEAGKQKLLPVGELIEAPEPVASDVIYSRISFNARESLALAAQQKWLIDGIIPADGFGVLYGPSGSYKSFVALDMAASIASGLKWHEFDTDISGGVLYIAAEGATGLLERQVAWENMRQVSSGNLGIVRMAIMADDALMAQAFLEAARKAEERMGVPIRFIVVDTMARSFSGDENSAKDVSAFIASCDRWRQELAGCTVMVVAHTGHDKTRVRGSTALRAACDFEYRVTSPGKLQALLKCTKAKDSDEPADMRFALDKVSTGIADSKGRMRSSLVPALESMGEDADPDADTEDESSPFLAKDINHLVGMVRSCERLREVMTEDRLRKEFQDFRKSEGNSDAAVKKAWTRAYGKAKEDGRLMKHGKKISLGEV